MKGKSSRALADRYIMSLMGFWTKPNWEAAVRSQWIQWKWWARQGWRKERQCGGAQGRPAGYGEQQILLCPSGSLSMLIFYAWPARRAGWIAFQLTKRTTHPSTHVRTLQTTPATITRLTNWARSSCVCLFQAGHAIAAPSLSSTYRADQNGSSIFI